MPPRSSTMASTTINSTPASSNTYSKVPCPFLIFFNLLFNLFNALFLFLFPLFFFLQKFFSTLNALLHFFLQKKLFISLLFRFPSFFSSFNLRLKNSNFSEFFLVLTFFWFLKLFFKTLFFL